MKEYERLTERTGKAIVIKQTSTNDNKSIWNAIERLAELEDDLESGKIIRLPCKVGDTVYCIYCDDEYNYWIEQEEVVDFIVTEDDIDIGTACRMIGKFKRIEVFLTKAEAEAKLKELKGEEDNDYKRR